MVFQIKNKIVMKKFLLILAITCQLSGFAQKMFTRSGVIKFEASMPAFEEIAATNNSVSCVFDKTNGDIATLALMKAFKFKSPLMGNLTKSLTEPPTGYMKRSLSITVHWNSRQIT